MELKTTVKKCLEKLQVGCLTFSAHSSFKALRDRTKIEIDSQILYILQSTGPHCSNRAVSCLGPVSESLECPESSSHLISHSSNERISHSNVTAYGELLCLPPPHEMFPELQTSWVLLLVGGLQAPLVPPFLLLYLGPLGDPII